MHRLFEHLRPTREQFGQAAVGEPFSYPTLAAASQLPLRLRVLGPDQRPCHADVTASGGRALVHIHRPALPGFYQVLQNDQLVATAAVNLDAREGDLRRASPAVLAEHLTGEELMVEFRDQQQEGPVLHVRGRPMWWWFVLAAMAAVGLELVVVGIWRR
jgi:hypothetical protein